jgi:chemotaxis-related protein WspD
MSEQLIPMNADQNCWTRIGVWGDSSCPQLALVSHCRNCEVYISSGRRLLDRPIPEDYLDSWSGLLVQEERSDAATAPYLVFRVGQVWLAFPATSLREITAPSLIRSVPHRPREILRGIVNVRGELYPCVSLHSLFGEEQPATPLRSSRFLVARRATEDWVFPVDQVDGIQDLAEQHIDPVPVTLSNTEVVYTRGLFRSGEKTVAIIDENLLFNSLVRLIA